MRSLSQSKEFLIAAHTNLNKIQIANCQFQHEPKLLPRLMQKLVSQSSTLILYLAAPKNNKLLISCSQQTNQSLEIYICPKEGVRFLSIPLSSTFTRRIAIFVLIDNYTGIKEIFISIAQIAYHKVFG